MKYVLHADSQNGEGWLDRKMSAAEGSFWLKDALVLLGMPPDEAAAYSPRSLKATCLLWAARSNAMTVQERLWMAHHHPQEGLMALTYSRDALIGVLAKLRAIAEVIKHGQFDPDLPRVEGLAMLTAIPKENIPELPVQSEEVGVPGDEAEDRDGSGVEDGDDLTQEPLQLKLDVSDKVKQPWPGVEISACLRHRLSGVVHVMVDVDKVACGRPVSGNYQCLDESVKPESLDMCEQCRQAVARL